MSDDLRDIRRAAFELRHSDPHEAVRVLRRSLKKGGQFEALAHGALGEILLDEFDDVDGALHHFERLLKLAPGLAAGELGLARSYAKSGRIKEAQGAYGRALASFEKLMAEAQAAEDVPQGVEEAALTALELAVEEREFVRDQPSAAPPCAPNAALLDWAETERIFDVPLDEEDDPGDVDDWGRYAALRAALLALDGKLEDALALVDRVTKAAPLEEVTTARLRSLSYEASGDIAKAAEALKAVDRKELDVEDLLRGASLLAELERFDDGRALLEAARVRVENLPEAQELRDLVKSRLEELPRPSLVALGLGRGRAS